MDDGDDDLDILLSRRRIGMRKRKLAKKKFMVQHLPFGSEENKGYGVTLVLRF